MSRKVIGVLVTAGALLLSGRLAVAHEGTKPEARNVEKFKASVEMLSETSSHKRHPQAVKALRRLADALAAIPQAPDRVVRAAAQIREDADKSVQSKRTSVHSDLTKDALANAVEALDALRYGPYGDVKVLPKKIDTARSAVEEIDPEVAFFKQRPVIIHAFNQVGDALEVVERQPVAGTEQTPTPPPAATPLPPEPSPPVTIIEPPAPPPPAPPPETVIVPPPPAPAPVESRPSWFLTQTAIEAGGGYASFQNKGMQDVVRGGGAWDVRLVFGAHSPIGVELGYVGTANELNGRMPAVDPNAVILGSAFEGDLRLSTPAFRRVPIQLFGFAGAGYNQFNLVDQNSVNRSPIANSDQTFVLPAGGGLQFNITEKLVLDGRFTYRAIFDENLLGNTNADMYTATGRLGYVF